MASVVYEVPTRPQPEAFAITMAGVTYKLRLTWCDAPEGGWVLDIATNENVPILNGIPLVTGANLLEQYAYLGIGGGLVVQTDHDTDAVPTYANLGSLSHLYFVVTTP